MPTLLEHPTRVQSAGNIPKTIDEYIGRLNNGEGRISVAHMRSPAGWQEPGRQKGATSPSRRIFARSMPSCSFVSARPWAGMGIARPGRSG